MKICNPLESLVLNDLSDPIQNTIDSALAFQNGLFGLSNYIYDFISPLISAAQYFGNAEKERSLN
jgi:hypothetical protein